MVPRTVPVTTLKNVLSGCDNGVGNGQDAVVSHKLLKPGGRQRIDKVVGGSAIHQHRESQVARTETCSRQGEVHCHEGAKDPIRQAAVLAAMAPKEWILVG